MENKKSQRKRRKHWLCSSLFLNCFLIFFYTNWIWLLSVVAMSVEDLASSQAMIHYGEDIAKNTGWYLSEYSRNMYSWNLALGLCNTNLSWFCSLTLVSLSPLMALVVSASKCWYPSSFWYGPLFFSLWILLHAPLWFIETTCGLLVRNLNVQPWQRHWAPDLFAQTSSGPFHCMTHRVHWIQ